MLRDNPLLTVLGRRGRSAVIEVLVREARPWSVRGLARAAGVSPATAARTVQELEWLAAVEVLRVGRDAQIRFLLASPVGEALGRMRLPDVRGAAAQRFVKAYAGGPGIHPVLWQAPGDTPSDPACPTRVALLCRGDPDAALDAAGPALDAVREAGWPAPEVTAWERDALDPLDPVAAAILAGKVP